MLTFFHPEQLLHHPQSYYSRGKMRTPQEVPERARNLLHAARDLGFTIAQPEDHGLAPLTAVHGEPYLRFLQDAHTDWRRLPEDWGDEVMSNIFVREPVVNYLKTCPDPRAAEVLARLETIDPEAVRRAATLAREQADRVAICQEIETLDGDGSADRVAELRSRWSRKAPGLTAQPAE